MEVKELKAGDEVQRPDHHNYKLIVTDIHLFMDERFEFDGIDKYGELWTELDPRYWNKTGRSFPRIAEAFNKLKKILGEVLKDDGWVL